MISHEVQDYHVLPISMRYYSIKWTYSEIFFQTSHFVSNHLIVRMLKLLTVWNVIYTFKRNRLLNRIILLIYISHAYWDNVYFSYLTCRKQHNMEVSTLLLNNSDAYFVIPLYNSVHIHLDIIKYAYRQKPDKIVLVQLEIRIKSQ